MNIALLKNSKCWLGDNGALGKLAISSKGSIEWRLWGTEILFGKFPRKALYDHIEMLQRDKYRTHNLEF